MWLCVMDEEKHNDEHCTHDIEWAYVDAAIDRLDNSAITWIQLGIGEMDENAIWFDVIGGNENRVFVIYRSEEPNEDYVLLDFSQTQKTSVYNAPLHDLMDWYEPEYIVDKSLAKRVIKHFFEHQERLTDGITWEKS